MKQSIKLLSMLLTFFAMSFTLTSCSDDDNDNNGIVGKWENLETYDEGNTVGSIKMVLTFNGDGTGRIVEEWNRQSRLTSSYTMDFSWSTTSDTNGNDILRVSYVSGDKNTELFPGGTNTVLWTQRYVLTANILNIYSANGGVWVFKR